jgi:hypothetical protein
MQKLFNPMLMLGLCYQGDATSASKEDFLVESLDIKLQEQGLLPEFDNFVPAPSRSSPSTQLKHQVTTFHIEYRGARLTT